MFKTSDLYLASYLKALGKDLEKTERKEKKVYFIFTEVSDAEVVGFYNNSPIGAIAYKDALNNLKTMIFHGGQ